MVIFALPVAIFGIGRLLAGDLFTGGVTVAIAALMILLPYHVTTPGDLPGAVAERAVGSLVSDDSEE